VNFDDAVAFATGALKADERFRDVDLSPSSATFNMVVLPFALMCKGSWDMVEWLQRYLLFGDPSQLSPEQLDNIGKMLMAPPRRTGSGVTVEVSLYFRDSPMVPDPIFVGPGCAFRSSSGALGHPLREQTLWHPSMPRVEVDGKDYRCATLPVRFDGVGAIPPRSVTQVASVLPGLAFARNEKASSAPVAAQSNAEYFNVIKGSLSARNDVDAASIAANYAGAYDVSDIFAAGFGDPEMQRDIAVAARGWSGHVGGRIDAYVKCPLMDAEYSTNAVTTSGDLHTFVFARYDGTDYAGTVRSWTLRPNAPPIAPIVLIDWDSTTICGLGRGDFATLPNGDVDYRIEVLPDPIDPFWGKNYRYSVYERLRLTVRTKPTDRALTGEVTLAYRTYANLEAIQLAAGENRLLGCDLLFRSFIPVHVQKLVVVYDRSYALDAEALAAALAVRINSWTAPTGIRFNELFDGINIPVRFEEVTGEVQNLPYVIDGATGLVAGVQPGDPARMPSYAVLHMDNIDGSRAKYISTRQIYPKTMTGLSATYRTCRYFVEAKDIEFIGSSWI